MYKSQYYTCEQIDQRLLQGYLDDYNSNNNTDLTKEQFLSLLHTLYTNWSDKSTINSINSDIQDGSKLVPTVLAVMGYFFSKTEAQTLAQTISDTIGLIESSLDDKADKGSTYTKLESDERYISKNSRIPSTSVYDDTLGKSQDNLNQEFYKHFYFLGNFDVSSGGEDAAYNIAATQGQDAPTFMYYTITSNNRTALVFNHWLGTVGLSKKISQYLLLDGTIFCRTLELINNSWTKPEWARGIDGGLIKDSSIPVSKIKNLNAVFYTQQTLTDAQKAQARTNIGAGDKDITDKFYVVDSWGVNEIFENSLPLSRLEAFHENYGNSNKALLIPLTFGSTDSGYVVGNVVADRYFVIEFTYNNTYYRITRVDTDQWSATTYQANGVVRYDITVSELTGGSISSDTMTKLNKLRADSYEDKMLVIRDGHTDIPFTVKTYGSVFEGYFVTTVNNTLSLVTVTAGTLTPATDWASTVIPLEKTSNKVTSWQSTPDDIHYPSEKLVKNSIDGVDNVFIAEYNVTTLQEVKDAVDSGKAVLCIKDGKLYTYTSREYNYYYFSNFGFRGKFTLVGVQDTTGNWEIIHNGNSVELQGNKVTSIDSNSTDVQYPSAKAVADYVSNAKTEVEYSIDGKYKLLTPVENSEGHFMITPLGVNYVTESVNTAIIVIDEGNSETPYGSVYDPDLGWLYTVIFKTGSTPNITFEFSQVSTDKTIVYPDDFSIEANRLYELSIMYIGQDVITNVKTYLLRIVDYTIPRTIGGSND